jgi:hypothetical protein
MSTETGKKAMKALKRVGTASEGMTHESCADDWDDCKDALHAAHAAVDAHVTNERTASAVNDAFDRSGRSHPGKL